VSNQVAPTTLGKIEFGDIKVSLINYLSKQSVFNGYEFEGSALSTLMDLLAYNAYYYAVYSNFIASECFLDSAQRIESLISLTKPLGYTIPSKSAARIKVKVSQVNDNIIPQYSIFYGTNSEGTQYTFYNLEPINVLDSQTDEFFIYEGISVVSADVINQFDFERQRVIITNTDIDIDTLEVQVLDPLNPNTYEIWTRIDNIGYKSSIEQKIYFVERIDNGFIISFGLINSVGKNITEDVRSLRIRYLRTNGTSGNNINIFSSPLGTVVTDPNTTSYGGKDDPSLDSIKFLAPKWFAAQERAVTVNDYKALILEAGYFANESEFNIFGGEEITPKRYGRVFITSQKQLSEVGDLMDFLKQKSVITVLPEYASSSPLNIYVDFKFGFNDGVPRTAFQKQQKINQLKTLFNQKYAKIRQYNLYFSATDFIEDIMSADSTIQISSDDFDLYVEQDVDAVLTDYNFNLQNEFDIPVGTSFVASQPFLSTKSSNQVQYVIDNQTQTPSTKPLILQEISTGIKIYEGIGTSNVGSGNITLKSNIATEKVKFMIPFKEKSIRIGLNNLITFAVKNVTVN
jgi:hypothetical protein